jgi:hypothetical protein
VLQDWDPSQLPYPELSVFKAHQALVLFGRDADNVVMVHQLSTNNFTAECSQLLVCI